LVSLSCSPSDCGALVGGGTLGGQGVELVTTGDEHSWEAHAVPPALDGEPGLLECPTAGVCWAAGGGSVAFTTDGGASWSAPVRLEGTVSALSCPVAGSCVAVVQSIGGHPPAADGYVLEVEVLSSSGDHVTAEPVGRVPTPTLGSFSCATTADCLDIATNAVLQTLDGGRTWHALDLGWSVLSTGDGPSGAVACLTGTDRCWLAIPDASGLETRVFQTADLGATWQQVGTLGGRALSLSCPTSLACAVSAVGPDGAIVSGTVNGWSTVHDSFPTGGPLGVGPVMCLSARDCLAELFRGLGSHLVRSTTPTGPWRPATLPSGLSLYEGPPTCPTPTTCLDIGYDENGDVVLRSVDGGARWSVLAPLGPETLSGLACPTARSCWMFGASTVRLAAATSTPLTVRRPPSEFPAGELNVSCTSPGFCLVEDVEDGMNPPVDTYFVSNDGGASWSTLAVPPQLSALQESPVLSCFSGEVCWLAGQASSSLALNLYRTADGGRTWVHIEIPGVTNDAAAGVSLQTCESASVCSLLFSRHGRQFKLWTDDGGSTWTRQRITNPASAQGCDGTGFCWAGASALSSPHRAGFVDILFLRPVTSSTRRHGRHDAAS